MSNEFPNKNHNIGGYCLIEKLEFEEFRLQIRERGIIPIRKLRLILVEKFGFKFWKDIHPDKALEQVIKCTKPIKSSEE